MVLAVVSSAAAAAAAAGCRRQAAEPPSQERPPSSAVRLPTNGSYLYEYADLSGEFRTVPSASDVPVPSRIAVRVIESMAMRAEAGDDEPVYVTDLTRAPGADGLLGARMGRSQFELRALAALPPGPGSRVQLAIPAEVRPWTDDGRDVVVLYETSWCGACRQTREYLRARNVPYELKDVERDPAAAAELAAKAAAAGVQPTRVPIVDVRGYLVIGFEPRRLATLIGDPT